VLVPKGMPLRVQVDKGYPMKTGEAISGHLIEPVYVGNGLAIPRGSLVTGRIVGETPAPRKDRVVALMNGDFTRLKEPVIEFNSLQLQNGQKLAIRTVVTERTTKTIHFNASQKHHSLIGGAIADAKNQITQKKADLEDTASAPNKMDRVRRFLYGQMPWHPQEVWAGTQFDADLTQPLPVPRTEADVSWPSVDAEDRKLAGTLHARLTDTLDSRVTKRGAPVHAVLTQPLMDADGTHVVLPEGTDLTGSVLQSKPARSFGRNGTLRFTFRDVAAPNEKPKAVVGQVVGAEGKGEQNLTIDSEGGVKANPDQGRFIAPLVLGLLANHSLDGDGNATATGAVSSNGFGVAARIVAMTAASPELTATFGFYGLAQSVYWRWIARGHDVTFPKNTELAIDLSER
jgi:hypothetical protein